MPTPQPAAADPAAPRRSPRRPRHLTLPAPAPSIPPTRLEPPPSAEPPTRSPDLTGVAYVFWPSEADRRSALAAEGRCRLLLLAADTPAPESWDPLEDWIREPFEAGDLEARVLAIEARTRRRAKARIDHDGVLHLHDRSTSLSDPQRGLVQLLLDRLGQVVPLTDLRRAHADVGAVGTMEATTRSLQRCRTKLRTVGLELHTVRGKGFLLTGEMGAKAR